MPNPNVGFSRDSFIGPIALDFAKVLADAYAQVGFAASKGLLQSIDAVSKPPSAELLRKMYTKLGELAKREVIEAYEERVDSNGHATEYRRGSGKNQRLTGRIKPLLTRNTEGTIYSVEGSGTNVRLELFNARALNTRAKHWRRLNFGAGAEGASGGGVRTYRIGGVSGSNLQLSFKQTSRPAYRIPKGYWYDRPGGTNVKPSTTAEPGGAFYLIRKRGDDGPRYQQEPKFSRGFSGRRFLDAGLAAVARATDDAFNKLIRDMIGQQTRLKFKFDVVGSSRD